jgi:hypothetical protein
MAIHVCYVCGKLGSSFQNVGKLHRCASQLCYLKALQGIDRIFIDANHIPPSGITPEWKLTITSKQLPFLGVDTAKKGMISVVDPFVPLPKEPKKVVTYGNPNPTIEYGTVASLIELLKIGSYTEEELVNLTKLSKSTVHSQLTTYLKRKYELEVKNDCGTLFYKIISEA